MMRKIMFILGIIVIIQGILFAAAPAAVRNFLNEHPSLATKAWMKTAPDAKLRISGIVMVVGAVLLEVWNLFEMGIL